jgi:hypothetical protein
VNRPTFFLLGASKAGTTSLHYYLAQHPDILMSDPKEPAYFRLEYERGADWYWRTYFRRYAGQRAAGDGAPQNLHLPFVAARIAATAPEARLLVLCRHPVERAVSAWRHNVRLGIEPLPFGAAVEKNLRRLERGETFEGDEGARRYQDIGGREGNAGLQRAYGFYVDPGRYAQHIERYHGLFGRERLLVLYFEDLVADPATVTARAVAFLGLPAHPLRDTRPQNEATSDNHATQPAQHTQGRAAAPQTANAPRQWRPAQFCQREEPMLSGYKAPANSIFPKMLLHLC